MADPRLTLVRDGLAAFSLRGSVEAERFADPEPRACRAERASLRVAPDGRGEQVNQLLFGEGFDVLAIENGWALGQARRDGYVGYLEADRLGEAGPAPTHWVRALRTYAFPEPDLKSTPPLLLSMNALLRVTGREGRFLRAEGAGWVVDRHLSPLDEVENDPAAVAERFIGAPYQWGGRESLGLDCSGLVQQALYACGRACPRDSDMQEALGQPIGPDDLARGDLVFWPGHVAMMLDPGTLIHANGHHMAVAIEPLAEAVDRIERAGEGAPTGFRRP